MFYSMMRQVTGGSLLEPKLRLARHLRPGKVEETEVPESSTRLRRQEEMKEKRLMNCLKMFKARPVTRQHKILQWKRTNKWWTTTSAVYCGITSILLITWMQTDSETICILSCRALILPIYQAVHVFIYVGGFTN